MFSVKKIVNNLNELLLMLMIFLGIDFILVAFLIFGGAFLLGYFLEVTHPQPYQCDSHKTVIKNNLC